MGSIGGLLGIGSSNHYNQLPQTNADQLQGALGGAQNSLQGQQALLQALQSQGGIGNQSQVYGQLQGVVNGTGPNPAQAQLAQATGANVANQAALMAGQRGAGANVGLMARQAAQQGAGIQQNAAGQAATLQADQSLNALNAAGNMANQQVANQIGATGSNTQANLTEQQNLLGAAGQQNAANAALKGQQTTGMAGLLGGIAGGIGSALELAEGGTVPMMAHGPQSTVGRFMKTGGMVPGKASVPGNSYANDKVNILASPGELVVDRQTMKDPGPAGQAARALAAIIAAKKKGGKK